jgi:hypothetical protein
MSSHDLYCSEANSNRTILQKINKLYMDPSSSYTKLDPSSSYTKLTFMFYISFVMFTWHVLRICNKIFSYIHCTPKTTYLAKCRGQWWTLVNAVINFHIL